MLYPDAFDDEALLLREVLPGNRPCEIQVVRLAEMAGDKDAGYWLTPEEREIHGKLHPGKRKTEWLAGRLAAKTAVARLLGRPLPRALGGIGILNLPGGKPRVQLSLPGLSVEISISHSGGLAAAMAAGFSCGLDVQQLSTAAVRVRDRFSSPEEDAVLAGLLPLTSAQEHLCLLWAAKESLRKMVSVAPVAGFRELRLLEGRATGRQQAVLRFSFQRQAQPPVFFPVAAFLQPGYAWAITGNPD